MFALKLNVFKGFKGLNMRPVFINSDLDLDHRHLGSNPMLPLLIGYPNIKFGIYRPKQTQVNEAETEFLF
jgi:hypothetical protein